MKCPKKDSCESKVNDFLQKIDDTIFSNEYRQYDTEKFIKFIDSFKNEIELRFRVDEHDFLKSRRNLYVNPWITPGIISSVTEKYLYYKL